jgi:hypothetical protein
VNGFRRMARPSRGVTRVTLIAILSLVGALLGADVAAAAAQTTICSGTLEKPGVLVGTYSGNVAIEGACAVDAGSARVEGNLTVSPDAALEAAYGLDDKSGTGKSELTVAGNVLVLRGATLLLGCEAGHFACLDDPDPGAATLSSKAAIGGSLIAWHPLGVVVHFSDIGKNFHLTGGGGGEKCESSGAFTQLYFPVYSDLEDTMVGGNVTVGGLRSCWLGLVRLHVAGSVTVVNDQLDDPDAIEILSNAVEGNLSCWADSNAWDSGDLTENTYPREPELNTVHGMRYGQCVHSSPLNEGEGDGTSPF